VRFLFGRRIRHPFYPALKPAPAAAAKSHSRALYGAFEELATAAGMGVRVARAVFPVRRSASPFLTDSQRDTLWDLFKVPVYALILDSHDEVVGYECEMQDSIHLREDYAARLLYGNVDSSPCDCGRPGPRLLPPNTTETAAAS
jgi:hypothetical protein